LNQTFAIDHGNRMIKTLNHAFPTGFKESDHLPTSIGGGDVLVYGGKEYILSEKRLAQRNDKTVDESFFILTLFAIGKELLAGNNTNVDSRYSSCVKMELLVGLPPLLYKSKYEGFERYFAGKQDRISFEFNGVPLTIEIVGAHAFPQAYAAALTVADQIQSSQLVNVVDLGGHTMDILQLMGLQPNFDICTTLNWGVNKLFRRINEQVRATGKPDIQDSVIESILRDDWRELGGYPRARIDLVRDNAQKYALELVSELEQLELDIVEDKTVFVGGCSILLKEFLQKTDRVKRAVFVDDVHANAKGYQMIFEMQKSGQGR